MIPQNAVSVAVKKNLISIKLHFLITPPFSLVDRVGWPRGDIWPRRGPAVRRAGAEIGGKIAGAGRGETDCYKYRETARAIEPPSECAIRRGGSAAIAPMVFNG
jgi:hypothetical protein